MKRQHYESDELCVRPIGLDLYVPPIVWKGDSVGHIGKNDLFFWVMEGECFLSVDSENYILRPGQLAYLPKGKMRAYTHVSEKFSMYELSFSITSHGKEIMEILGLCDHSFVVDVPNPQEVTRLFEDSSLIIFAKNPLHELTWGINVMSLVKIYIRQRQRLNDKITNTFKPVLEYMAENIQSHIKTEQLAALVFMQPTYFIRKFKEAYGLPPTGYLNRMRIYKAMGMLSGTNLGVDEIAEKTGFSDTSYFARVFKKQCKLTPTEYRAEFNRNK